MKKINLLLFTVLLWGNTALAQVGVAINEDNSSSDASAMLDVKSTNKGMLIPRMTSAQRTVIAAPATGLLVFDNSTNSFWFYDGSAWTELLAGTDSDNQALSLSGNTLGLVNGGSVNLGGYLDNTDNQRTDVFQLSGNTLQLSLQNDGVATQSVNLSSLVGTDNQDLSLSGNTLSLTNDGTTVNLGGYLDNTDNQALSLSGNTLGLVNGGSVNLGGYLDNTDNQRTDVFQLSGNTLQLSLQNDGVATQSVNLSSLVGTDNQDLSLSGNTLSLTNDGTTVNLSGYLDNTDNQNLSYNTTTGALSIQNGNSVNLATGDILGVTAGTGLTGGGNSGTVTINAVGDNGLTTNANDIDLGGALNQNTTITQGANSMTYNLNGTGDFVIQDNGTNQFVVQDNGDVRADNTTFYVDASTNRVGVGIAAPIEDLHVFRADTDVARVYATGTTQGSGMFYAGQSVTYGGGFVYDGDGAPALVGGTDRVTFFRRTNGTDTDVMSYAHDNSTVRIANLAGTGNRVVVANAAGDLSTQTIASMGDNLGNHVATQNLNMANNDLTNVGDIFSTQNYGMGLVGRYSATRYQNLFSMGAAYRLAADGTNTGNLYGIAWTHSNVGGESIAGLGHQALFMTNGDTRTAIGDGVWTKYNVTGNRFYDQNNTAYYADPAATSILNSARLTSLAGTGTRVVVANATGDLSTQTVASMGDNLGNHTATTGLNMSNNSITNTNIVSMVPTPTYDKLRVWNSSSYTIGMNSAMTFGYLNDYATTFTMNQDDDRGWIWRDINDAKSDGAASLTTDGRFTVKSILNSRGSLIVATNAAIDGTTFNVDATNNRVGVGTAAPTEKLQVLGNVYASSGDFYTANANGVINCGGGIMNANANVIADGTPTITIATGDEDLYIADDLEVNSNAYKPGGGTWTTISDKRLKKDITPFTDGLSEIMQIKPVTFKYNDKVKVHDKDRVFVGIIAQDLEKVAPYMIEKKNLFQSVREDENGVEEITDQGEEYLTYDGNAMTYLLINAVQEQQKEIADLKKELEEVADLKKELEEIKLLLKDMDK